MEQEIDRFCAALEALDRVRAEAIFYGALARMPPVQAIERLVVPALDQMGRGWQEGRVALSQVYMGSRYCEELVGRVLPPSDPDRKRQPRAAIAVLDDHHLLGKQIVYSVLRASGFELFDYGSLGREELVERVLADRLEVLLISVLMLPSALGVAAVVAQLRARGSAVRIAVGGALFLFDAGLWREVGADAMGRNAADAVKLLEGWMGEAR